MRPGPRTDNRRFPNGEAQPGCHLSAADDAAGGWHPSFCPAPGGVMHAPAADGVTHAAVAHTRSTSFSGGCRGLRSAAACLGGALAETGATTSNRRCLRMIWDAYHWNWRPRRRRMPQDHCTLAVAGAPQAIASPRFRGMGVLPMGRAGVLPAAFGGETAVNGGRVWLPARPFSPLRRGCLSVRLFPLVPAPAGLARSVPAPSRACPGGAKVGPATRDARLRFAPS